MEYDNLDRRLGARLKGLRGERALTIDALAERAGVSRSMISLIERGESSPTAKVLDRLAVALGAPLAALFAEPERADADPVRRRADQTVWRDPGSGYLRRALSPPAFPSPIELAEVVLPAGARVAYDTGPRRPVIDQQVWLLEGAIELTVGETVHALATGDCLAMRIDGPTAFHNPTDQPARYLVAVTADARNEPRSDR